MNVLSSRLGTLLLAASAALAALPAAAQRASSTGYPEKPIRFIVPYPPGGGTDVIARVVQDRFRIALGQTIVIDNRGGAAGSVGSDIASKAPADGYTVLFTLSSHTMNPSIYAKLPFDTARDFEPVGTVASLPQILVANPQFPASTVAEVIALAKSKPDTISFASVGNGSPGHFAGEMLNLRAGIHLTHIPYRGGGPAVTDVMGGQVPLLWVSIPAAAEFVKQGRLKAIAVSTVKRSAAFPNVPTMQEAGIADFEVDSWYAMFVPAKTPKPIIEKLNKALNVVVADPEVREKLLAQGSEGVGGTPEALGKVVTRELAKWSKIAKEANIRAE
jgi:tripartite-type tricarboxylate transporter receptor subunit TctC